MIKLEIDTNTTLDNINDYKFAILDSTALQTLVVCYNKLFTNKHAIEQLINTSKWECIEVTKFYINTKHVCLFYYKKNWYITCSNDNINNTINTKIITKIFDIEKYNTNEILKVFLLYLENLNIYNKKTNSINFLDSHENEKSDTHYSYHFLIKHNSFKKITKHMSKNDYGISLLWIADQNCNVVNDTTIHKFILDKIPYEKKVYFSCLDELLTSLDTMNNDDIITKNIQYGGYYIKIYDDDRGCFKSCFLSTEIYEYVTHLLPNNKNQYKFFLELYQSDKLSETLPYLHNYPAAVVRRINMSLKTLSKEILNIYHLTRNLSYNLQISLLAIHKVI